NSNPSYPLCRGTSRILEERVTGQYLCQKPRKTFRAVYQKAFRQFEVLSANAFAERHETEVACGQASQRKRPHAPPRPAASLLAGVRQMPSRCLSGMKHWLLHWQLLQGGYSLTPLAPAAGPLHRDKI